MADEARLADLCETIVDCPHSTPVWMDSGVVVLRNQNIRNGRLDLSQPSYTDEAHFADRTRRALPREGDLVITREAPMGEVCMIPPDLRCCLGQRMVLLRPNRQHADPGYLLYALQSKTVQHEIGVNEGTGSTVSNLRIPLLEALRIPTRPVPEQRAISEILGTLDDKIELNRRMNETLEAMARALFQSWFVDFDPVRAKAEGRDPGLPQPHADLFPGSFEDSELGEIPRGWRVKSFADTIEILGGGTPKTSVKDYWGGDIPWFSVVDAPAVSEVWVVDTEKKISNAGVENSSTRVLPVGTTIISARGTVGRIALVGTPMAMNQSCYGLRGLSGTLGFFSYFSTRELVVRLQQHAHGSVFDTITRDTLAGVSVVEPPMGLVEQFELGVAPWLDRILVGLQEARTLATLRDTLLPKLISGELRVPDAERFLERVAV